MIDLTIPVTYSIWCFPENLWDQWTNIVERTDPADPFALTGVTRWATKAELGQMGFRPFRRFPPRVYASCTIIDLSKEKLRWKQTVIQSGGPTIWEMIEALREAGPEYGVISGGIRPEHRYTQLPEEHRQYILRVRLLRATGGRNLRADMIQDPDAPSPREEVQRLRNGRLRADDAAAIEAARTRVNRQGEPTVQEMVVPEALLEEGDLVAEADLWPQHIFTGIKPS